MTKGAAMHDAGNFHLMSFRRMALLGLVAAAAVGFSTAAAEAQQAASGGSGAFGARNLGSSFTPSAGGFTAAGNRGASGNGMAAAGMGGVSGMTQRGDNSAGQVTGNERFVRGARRPGQFVGADNSDSTNFLSQLSQMQGQFGPQRNNNGANNPNRQQNNRNSRQKTPRVELDVGFDYRTAGPTEQAVALQNRFTQSSRPSLRGRVIVNLEGRIAVLRGSVATEHDRVLAAQVALLEAGVSQVRNELQVVQTEPLPPPASLPQAVPQQAVPQQAAPPANPPVLQLQTRPTMSLPATP